MTRSIVLALGAFAVCATGCSYSDAYEEIPFGCAGAYTPDCSDGEVCLNAACVPCGGQGEACCDPTWRPVSAGCDDLTAQCVAPFEGFAYCDSNCGALGEPCCNTIAGPDCGVDGVDDDPSDDVSCDSATSTCVYSDACFGDTWHSVELIGADHCVLPGPYIFESDTPNTCIAAHIANAYPGANVTAGPLDVDAAIEGEYCAGGVAYPIKAMTAVDLALCQQALCPNCAWTSCPTQ